MLPLPMLRILPAVVEKDVWVCWVLDVLFSIPARRPMVFKGGTSLSKVFNLIKRFSEDIDISINFLQDYEAPISKTKASNIREEIEANLQTIQEWRDCSCTCRNMPKTLILRLNLAKLIGKFTSITNLSWLPVSTILSRA